MKKFVGDVVREYYNSVRKILINKYGINHKDAEILIENSDFYRYLETNLQIVELSSPDYWAESIAKTYSR